MSTPTDNSSFILPRAGSGLQSIYRTTLSPVPTPLAHEVLVRIHAVSLNFRDHAMVSGRYPATLKEDLVLGSDVAGEVVEVGDKVTGWKVGERISAVFDQGHMYGPAPRHRTSLFLFIHLFPTLSSI